MNRPLGTSAWPVSARRLPVVIALLAALGVACRRPAPSETETQKPDTPEASPAVATDAAVAIDVTATSAPRDGGIATADSSSTPEPPEPALEGALFTKQVQAAFRVAGCGGDDSFIPAHIDKELVDAHCTTLTSSYDEYKREWLDVAVPFIAKLRPAELPTTVVYPFGGGDLVSALATFPDATEITTISLEIAGDVRAIDKADKKRLGAELTQLRAHLGKLFLKAHSRTVNLDIETHGAIPGEVAYTMAALVIHGYEPVTLRYFAFAPDGSVEWLTEEAIAKDKRRGRQGPFANAEIRFRKRGESKVRALRHVAFDLSDGSLRSAPFLVKHLQAKGKVAAMTKAASYLLWDDAHFSVIRDYLMKNTDWMISDTTGVPPRIAKKHGFVQDVYGAFERPEPFGPVNNADAKAYSDLFKTATPISFRYGYPDDRSHGHIVVTRKPEVVAKH